MKGRLKMTTLGVYPVFDLKFKIEIGPGNRRTDMVIKDMETFSPGYGNVEWTMDTEGWVHA